MLILQHPTQKNTPPCQVPAKNFIEVELAGSGISQNLGYLNLAWVQGEAVVDILSEYACPKARYATVELTRIRRRFEEMAEYGGWVCYGQTIDGYQSEVAMFKPVRPRQARKGFGDKVKPIKYETPIKAEGLPILPWVDEETISLVERRWRVTFDRTLPFWKQLIDLPQVPVAITEGVKKALALLSQGLPAIAVRGICMWRTKGTDQLHERLAYFAQKGRLIFIAFDQDQKPATRKQVAGQSAKIAKAYSQHGSDVRILTWSPDEGKGIDDYLVAFPESQRWNSLKSLIDTAKSYKKIKREALVNKALQTLQRRTIAEKPEQITTGNFVPTLPALELGKIHLLTAPLGTGKTHRIGQDWVKPWLNGGKRRRVIVLSPLNSLGQQTAQRWGLPHINDYPLTAEGRAAMLAAFGAYQGMVLCPDSLLRLPAMGNKDVLLVMDEVNQVLEHLIGGNTLGDRWSEVVKAFITLLRSAGAVCASEAVIPQPAVDLLKALSGKPVRYFQHLAPNKQPWSVHFYTGHASKISGFFSDLISALEAGQKLFFVTSSKLAGEKLEIVCRAVFGKSKSVTRIDSETNSEGAFTSFFTAPDDWLAKNKPDLIIASPSVKSGVSIDKHYFDAVWGYFPSGTVDTHYQLLGRYRQPVPRHIYISDISFGDSDDSFSNWVVKQRLETDAKALAQYLGIPDIDYSTETSTIMDFVANMKASHAAQQSASREYLKTLLTQDGHLIADVDLVPNPNLKQLLTEAKQAIEQQRAAQLARAVVTPQHSVEWAFDTLSRPCSVEDSYIAKKVLLQHEFPSVDFDNLDICFKISEKYGKLLKGIKLHAHALDLPATKIKDAIKAEKILNQDLQALHKLPQDTICAFIIHSLGVLELVDRPYSNEDDTAIAVKQKALQLRGYIWRYLRLVVNEEMSPSEIVNKLLRKLGLQVKCVIRKGTKVRLRIYQAQQCPIRTLLLQAYQQYLANKYQRPENPEPRQDKVFAGRAEMSPQYQTAQTDDFNPPPDPIPDLEEDEEEF